MPDLNAVDALIFDVDGTLWDITQVAVHAYNQVLMEEKGQLKPYKMLVPEDLKAAFGKPMQEVARQLIPCADKDRMKEIMDKVIILQDQVLHENTPEPYPHMREVVRHLSERYPLFIVSNSQAGYIEFLMEATGIGPWITDHYCPGDTGLLKADNIRLTMEKYHLQHPAYVGDTLLDEEACRSVGIPFIYASYGFGKAKAPDASIRELKDLLRLFPGK